MDLQHLSNLAKKRQLSRAEAVSAYARMIRITEPSDEDYAALADLADILGKSDDDLASDLRAIFDMERGMEEIDAAFSPEAEQNLRQLQIETAEFQEETRLLIQSRNEQLQDLCKKVGEIELKQMRARQRCEQLTRLKKTHWELFGCPRPSAPELNS